eukprot:SAG31_NODE_1106_length_9878_cov_4.621331_13_plen_96_part_00
MNVMLSQYDEEGDEHWYFMSIDAHNIIDASRCHRTKSQMQTANILITFAYRMANLSRFLNHSCEPNCATQKVTAKQNIFTTRANRTFEFCRFDFT